MPVILSGHSSIDRYLAEGYDRVRGMSSRFSAAICGYVLARQTALSIRGDVAEIGAFEGRFLIALALGLTNDERALAIDTFDWPNDGVQQRFLDNCTASGLDERRVTTWKVDSRSLAAGDLRSKLGGRPVRFFHVDGDHSHESLNHDLELAHAVMHPSGIICIDDMLHPGYPTLVTAVLAYMDRHADMRVFCIIDREDIVAAAKFLICHKDAVAVYEGDLMTRFAPFHYVLGADFRGHFTLVLTPHPRIADVG